MPIRHQPLHMRLTGVALYALASRTHLRTLVASCTYERVSLCRIILHVASRARPPCMVYTHWAQSRYVWMQRVELLKARQHREPEATKPFEGHAPFENTLLRRVYVCGSFFTVVHASAVNQCRSLCRFLDKLPPNDNF